MKSSTLSKLAFSILLIFNISAKTYEEIFPNYFEYCTATQVKYTKNYFNGAVGGPGGHGFIYVHGLCKDNEADYPRVKACANSNQGTGISLDSDYANVMWIAVPSRDLFFNGLHSNFDESPVDRAELDNLIEEARKLKVFKGVKLKAKEVTQFEFGTTQYENAAANWSIGTDIGLRIGRELRCVRTPINKQQIVDLSKYLNDQNDKYFLSDLTYDWSFLSNNCTHLTLNAGHSIGLNKSIKTDQNLAVQIGNIAIPANAFMNLADKWVLNPPKLNKILKSESYKKYKMYPNQVGALIYKLEAFQSNEMFLTNDIKGISLPRFQIKRAFKKAKGYDQFMIKENSLLAENIKKWKNLYQELNNQYLQNDQEKVIKENYFQEQLDFISSIESFF